MKVPINHKNGWKIMLFLIWTGIFIAASCIIVKGSGMLSEDLKKKYSYYEELIFQKAAEGILKQGSPLWDYRSETSMDTAEASFWSLERTWNLASYLREKNRKMYLSEDEGNRGGKKETAGEILLQQDILQKDFPFLAAEGYYEDETTEHIEDTDTEEVMALAVKKINQLKTSQDMDFLLKNFYIVDSTTSASAADFQVKALLERDMTMEKKRQPQILIYHTHGATEGFTSSTTGEMVSIIQLGEKLAKILEEDYGYEVIHDETPYDKVNGSIDRNKAYNQSLEGMEGMLKKYPSIEVLIDLHRDGIGSEDKRTTVIHGKTTAKFMLFNGLSRNKEGPIAYLYNPNLEGNLAFSLQLKLKAMELYPTLTRPNYLKGYRYNLHLREKSLLIELGNQNNTYQEAVNALEPLAEVLDAVLQGK